MHSLIKLSAALSLSVGALLTSGCASQFTFADPVVSEDRATVLTRGLISENGDMAEVFRIHERVGGKNDHYWNVSHVSPGRQKITLRCTNKYTYGMYWNVRNQEYVLEPKKCYVPRYHRYPRSASCDVHLTQTSCAQLKRLRSKEQKTYVLPAPHSAWTNSVEIE